jgi:serine/threonine protein kinase
MGEVYRAHDLTVGRTVALKFLPAEWKSHESALARFRNEVRIARQVSHPNVCRMYDIGETEGSTYLPMEYVDEGMASLSRRIGRLPRDKALEIARQLRAGVAAAYDKCVGSSRCGRRNKGSPRRTTGVHGARAAFRTGGNGAERPLCAGRVFARGSYRQPLLRGLDARDARFRESLNKV